MKPFVHAILSLILLPAAAISLPAQDAGAPAPAENTTSPSIEGHLLDLAKTEDLSGFKTQHTTISLAERDGAKVIQGVFAPTSAYPNVRFPVPEGGWNLSAFAGIQVDVTNVSGPVLTVFLRADNPGDWKKSPWNTGSAKIGPGETKTVTLTFGKNGAAPGYPLDPTRVSAIQVFLNKPQQEVTLQMSGLKAWGSPGDKAAGSSNSLSSPEDRTKPVTPPEWLGQRPPVDGEWVQTFNDEFDGTALDEKLWFPCTAKQCYSRFYVWSPDNVRVENGVLKLKVVKEATDLGRQYISGQISGFGKWAQAYGYFEARVKLPTTRGFWPAFWMMPDRDVNGSTEQQAIWDRNSTKKGGMEFDILEHLCEWGPGRHNVAVHWDGYGEFHKAWGDSHVYYGPTPDGWHVFGMLWEPGKLTWYIDGIKKMEWANERVGSVPAHFLVSLQMGGWATKDVDLSNINQTFDVDYVRAWQLKSRMP